MIEVTIKTLDAQNHHFTVPGDFTVEQLKVHIADTIQIPSDSQRCIYLGQILQNETKLADCNVDGKVIHVVQRAPPSNLYNNENPNGINDNNTNQLGTPPNRRFETHGTMYLGAMTLPSDVLDTGGLTFLHPRTNLSGSRLLVARNLLRRALNVMDRLERGNYFDNQEPGSQSQPIATSSSLTDDIMNGNEGNGLGQSDVEIRIESPNVQDDMAAEALIDSISEPSEIPLSNGTSEESAASGTSEESSSSSQNNGEATASGSTRDDGTRRRNSRTSQMAVVMGAVLHAQVNLIPYMRLLRLHLLQDTAFDPNTPTTHTEQQIQTLFNSVSELMHYFSHIYHSLSDIMCDFSQPPPRTLRCRPIIIQQPQAHVFRSGRPRGRTVVRPPVWSVSRSTSTNPASESDSASNGTTVSSAASAAAAALAPTAAAVAALANAAAATTVTNSDSGSSTVEVVIEEADTTNLNNDEGNVETMDTSETNASQDEGRNGRNASQNDSRLQTRVRNENDNQFLQSLLEGLLPDGVRVNSMEATILAPNDGLATVFSAGPNSNWRSGTLPADILQNVFGFVNQLRQSQRPPRSGTNDRIRSQGHQSSIAAANAGESNQATNNASSVNDTTTENGDDRQGQNNVTNAASAPQNGSIELDITALTQTFDPFLPCHSHHINPIVSRASGLRNGAVRSTTNSTNASAGNSSQGQPSSQSTAEEQRNGPEPQVPAAPASNDQEQSAQQLNGRRAEEEGEFFIPPRMPGSISNLFSSIIPGLMRRGTTVANGSNNETDINNQQDRPAARARIQVMSNLNTFFPGAIQIEIDPLTNNVQTSFVGNNENPRTESNVWPRRTRTASRRSRRVPEATNNSSNPSRSDVSFPTSSNSAAALELSSSSDDEIDLMANVIRARKDKNVDPKFEKTIRYLYSLVKSETKSQNEKNGQENYPLYVEDQETSLLDLFDAVFCNTSFEEIVRNSKSNVDHVTSSIREKLKKFLTDRMNIATGNKSSLLNAVNILINNDLHKMKNLLDSSSVKQEIDLVTTICKFNHDNVPKLILDIIQTEELNCSNGVGLRKMFSSYIARLILLFLHCLTGEDKTPHIKKILGVFVEEIIKKLPSDKHLVRWLRNDFINLVIAYSKICNPEVLPPNMRHFVVYRLPSTMPVECTVATATITNIRDNDMASENAQSMDVEETVHSTSPSSSESSFVSAISDVPQTNAEENTNVATTSNNEPAATVNPVLPAEDVLPEVVLNSEEWHRSIPSEWVPIITRDIHRLRRQGSQPPFSDAYLSGMPTKRRKLIRNSKPNIQENGHQIITDNMSTAIDAAGISASVNPIINRVVEQNVSGDCLSDVVKEELKENVRENMVQQQDFLPHRFPDSSKYFMDK